jgi:hypothetical protein
MGTPLQTAVPRGEVGCRRENRATCTYRAAHLPCGPEGHLFDNCSERPRRAPGRGIGDPDPVHPRTAALRRVCYATLLACTAVDLALWSLSPFDPLQNTALRDAGLLTLLLGAITAALYWVRPRVEPHLTMDWLRRVLALAPGVFELLMFYRWLPFAITAASYMILPWSLPLADPWLAGLEEPFGLSHPRTRAWFAEAGLLWPLNRAYASVDLQLWLMTAYFVLWKRDLQRVWEYTAVVAVAGLTSIAMLWAFPAEGPWAWYGAAAYADPPPAPPYLDVLRELREGRLVDLDNPHGFLNFPSFHTVFALMIAWTMRGNGWLSVAAWAVSAAVVLSVVPIGWHYLVDVPGGVVWTVAAVVAVERWIEPPRAPVSPG